MIEKQKKYEILNRILESKEFKKSEVFKNLLTYLVECSVEGYTPKEYTIAIEVFNKESSFDPSSDTTVRVYIYKLRKKLEYYYKTEAKHEKIRLVIPKGNYDINFVNQKNETRRKNKYFLVSIVLGAYIIISHLFFVLKPWSQYSNMNLTQSPFWANFFKTDQPQMVVVGDHFFYVDSRMQTLQRRDYINSLDDFFQYLGTLDSSSAFLGVLPYTLFPKNSVWPLQQLQSSILVNQQYEFKAASKVNADNLNHYNILFVGSFHTLGILKETFRNSHFKYHVAPNSLSVINEETSEVIRQRGDPCVYHVDYGVVRKLPGPNNNTIYIFSSFHETGMIGIVQYFTDPQKMKEFDRQLKEKFEHVPEYFELVFKAAGYNRITSSTEILNIFNISSDQHFW